MSFPFLNLKKTNDSIAKEIRAAIDAVTAHGKFIMGPEVAEFERQWATFCKVPSATGCANGTAALHAILACLNVAAGDEVILPSHTFIASAESIRLTGATPVFADIDNATMLVSVDSIREKITPRTKAIMPVQLYGAVAEMDAINALACEHEIYVVEDASQAHGARYHGKPAGSLGYAAAFSFFPGKNLGAFGDAGAATCIDENFGNKVRLYVNHGREGKYEHLHMGTNYRLDTIQAAILLVKLQHLQEWTAQRRRVAVAYIERLKQEPFVSAGVRYQQLAEHVESCYHLFVIRVPNRDAVMENLNEAGVGTGIHYPLPCHLQPSMAEFSAGKGSLPITERVTEEIISMPMCPTMTESDVDKICDILAKAIV